MLHRLQSHYISYIGAYNQKSLVYKYYSSLPISNIKLSAGLYKPSTFFIQYSLMLSNLSGKPSSISYQAHGKRNRQTISATATIFSKSVWPCIDKFTHEIFPILSDFLTPKWKKNNKTLSYTLRLRHKFLTYDVFDILTSATMYDTHKGVFLPLSIHINFGTLNPHALNEGYLHMFRLPISLYKRRFRPAFDDKISFNI
jgi:hypothetical protein